MARLHSAVAGRARPLRERATCSQLAGMWCACCCRETASFSKKQMRLVWGGGSARCKTCVAAAEAAKREEERRAKQRRLDAAAADVERDASPQRPRLFLADAKSPYLVEVEVPADGVPVGVAWRVAGRTLTLRRDSGPRVCGFLRGSPRSLSCASHRAHPLQTLRAPLLDSVHERYVLRCWLQTQMRSRLQMRSVPCPSLALWEFGVPAHSPSASLFDSQRKKSTRIRIRIHKIQVLRSTT